MRTLYGLDVSETCAGCTLRKNGFFCQFSPDELRDFDAIKHVNAYPERAFLFVEQQKSRGFFHLCQGEVKLSVSSNEGKTLVVRVARAGDVLGMWAALSGVPYEATAECLRPCQVAFVSSRDYRQYLRRHPAVFERTAYYLGRHYVSACEQLCVIGLGASVLERVVKFLLDWSAARGAAENCKPFPLALKHGEVAEHIGATRESVTRALSSLFESGLVRRHGCTLMIPNRNALAAFGSNQDRTRSSGLDSPLVHLSPAAPRHEPRVIAMPDRQPRAKISKQA